MCPHCNMDITYNDNIIEAPETRGEFKEYLQKNKRKQIIVYARILRLLHIIMKTILQKTSNVQSFKTFYDLQRKIKALSIIY